MKSFFIDISPKSTSGFCNQIYSILYPCRQAIRENVGFIFLGKFLIEINSNKFCKISEIIDIDSTNNYLKQFNIFLVDYHNFEFNIVNASYGYGNMNIDVTQPIKNFFNKNILYINKTVDLNKLVTNPVEFYKKNFFINLDPHKLKLFITYKINNQVFKEEYEQTSGFLNSEILIDLANPIFQPSIIKNDGTEFTRGLLNNIFFKDHFIQKAHDYVKENINKNDNNNKKINCIHMRLEDDAIEHWAKENKMHPVIFKQIIEDKYIDAIKKHLDKMDTTIILSSNYDNRAIDFLKENNYNIVLTPKMSEHREVAAIYDLHIGQYCNNVYICVFDSSFSYTLLYRIFEQSKIKSVDLNYIL